MNERIKEFYEQAVQLVANEHTKGDVSRLNTDSYHVKDLINTKFAELIVAECIEIIEPCKCGCRCEQEVVITDSIIADIKEHFGVEE